jgi:hypothetical protein
MVNELWPARKDLYTAGDPAASATLREKGHLRGAEGRPPPFDDDELATTQPLRATAARPRWEIHYARAVAVADLTAMAVSLLLHQLWARVPAVHHERVTLGWVLMVLTAAALGLMHAWDPLVLGQGSQEFSRLLRALLTLAVVIGLVGLALKLPAVRPYAFGVVPLAFILATVGRLALRTVLHRRRCNGACMHDVLAVGTAN